MSSKNSLIYSGILQFSLSAVTALFALFQIHYLSFSFTTTELGILAVIIFMSTLCQNISEAGLGAYVLHREKITKEVCDGTSITAMIVGLFVAFLSVVVGFILYKIYGSYNIVISSCILSAGFLISSLSAVYQSFLLKLNRVNFVSVSDFLSKNLSVLFSLVLINIDVGVIAIPISILFSLVFKLLIYTFGLRDFEVKLIPRTFPRENINDIVRFSLAQLSGQIVNSISAKLDELIIGKFMGLQVLGVYSLFKNIIVQAAGLVLPIARRLFMPILSNSRIDQKKTEGIILLSHNLFTVFAALYFGFAFVFSREITEFVFDKKILASHNILSVLAVIWFFRTSGGCLQTACVQIYGKPWLEFTWNVIQGLMVVLIVSIVSLIGFQIEVVLYSVLCIYILSFFMSFSFFYSDIFGDLIVAHITKVVFLGFLKVGGILAFLMFLYDEIEYDKANIYYWLPFYLLCSFVFSMLHFRFFFEKK